MKKHLGKVIATGFGVLFAILLIEIIGRQLHLLPAPLTDAYFEVREDVGTYPEPYSYFWWNNFDNQERIWVQFNSASRRDIEHAYEKPESIQRIMFLGDSYTAGWQVQLNETFVAQLRTLTDDDSYQFINAGFHGWGTDRQYLYYRDEGYRYDSDLVILQIYVGNDVRDNGVAILESPVLDDGRAVSESDLTIIRPYFTLDVDGNLSFNPPRQLTLSRQERIGGVRSFTRHYSFSYFLLEQLINLVRERSNSQDIAPSNNNNILEQAQDIIPIDYYGYSPEAQEREDWDTAWDITEQLLLTLRETVNSHGGELVVLLVDTRWEHDPEGFEMFRETWALPSDWQGSILGNRMRDLLDTNDIPYIAPLPALLEFTQETNIPTVLRIDGHWTATGHCVVAVELYNWFIENNTLPDDTSAESAITYCANP